MSNKTTWTEALVSSPTTRVSSYYRRNRLPLNQPIYSQLPSGRYNTHSHAQFCSPLSLFSLSLLLPFSSPFFFLPLLTLVCVYVCTYICCDSHDKLSSFPFATPNTRFHLSTCWLSGSLWSTGHISDNCFVSDLIQLIYRQVVSTETEHDLQHICLFDDVIERTNASTISPVSFRSL